MPPKFEVRDALRTLERAGLENKLPVWDNGRMIVNEGHIALKGDEMVFATRRYRAPTLRTGASGDETGGEGACHQRLLGSK